ncbi:hypothetical protein [Amycolatopsis cihanbeyliensis]|uniref:hypothetical protein n=1 Tax=Amycolatopsis cihanbeyliensis TaxID=1128664 RepID=UPI003CCC6979
MLRLTFANGTQLQVEPDDRFESWTEALPTRSNARPSTASCRRMSAAAMPCLRPVSLAPTALGRHSRPGSVTRLRVGPGEAVQVDRSHAVELEEAAWRWT